ncbi:HoxN/HupN/NixA family nickel/cobalt transporter [Crenobacter sp. SG2303]|uniref:Nickel/cobalt efflux system n=1 Tax=Crenobacter oryzisoli TaxID=3056844 RepID=A0ABT7XNI7_9NEIS|nr:HoxN/HupN/NixA family nickel/cobalt transporter [Crenobacter sp. SG2303]MDN0075357.1 HoxN/HupN/NixA family nickel/cobalt transporter [Crenobacter sp. SG2303]
MSSPLLQSSLSRSPLSRRVPLGLLALLVGINLAAWFWALTAFAGHPALAGTALLAYLLGLRHAVDADHIAAIDNTVRKLMQDNQRPLAVGFFFAAGHSTIVLIGVVVILFATATLQGQMKSFSETGSLIGTGVSALFLLVIALYNMNVLRGVWRNFRLMQRGTPVSEEQLDILLGNRGLLARLLRPLFRLVTKSWHMFPIGFLFGLGFDTATEVGLFALSATHSVDIVPVWHILALPVLFAAGMSLVDTLDSMLMVGAYGWAFVKPVRKLWYNLTITLVSVVIAVVIGGLEALGLIARKFELAGGIWDIVATLNENLAHFGYIVIALFVASWVVSAAIYKWKRYDTLADGH